MQKSGRYRRLWRAIERRISLKTTAVRINEYHDMPSTFKDKFLELSKAYEAVLAYSSAQSKEIEVLEGSLSLLCETTVGTLKSLVAIRIESDVYPPEPPVELEKMDISTKIHETARMVAESGAYLRTIIDDVAQMGTIDISPLPEMKPLRHTAKYQAPTKPRSYQFADLSDIIITEEDYARYEKKRIAAASGDKEAARKQVREKFFEDLKRPLAGETTGARLVRVLGRPLKTEELSEIKKGTRKECFAAEDEAIKRVRAHHEAGAHTRSASPASVASELADETAGADLKRRPAKHGKGSSRGA